MAEIIEEKKAKKVVKINAQTDFPWAFNKTKLKQAYTALVDAQKLDKSVVIDEDSIKEEYVKRAGLLSEEAKENLSRKRPRSTSNIDR